MGASQEMCRRKSKRAGAIPGFLIEQNSWGLPLGMRRLLHLSDEVFSARPQGAMRTMLRFLAVQEYIDQFKISI